MSTVCRWCVIGFLLLAAPAGAQNTGGAAPPSRVWERWVLENRDYYEPLLAEPRAARIVALPLASGSEYPYMIEKGRRRLWDISLGKEIPILGVEGGRASSCTGSTHAMPAGCWGFGLWLPVSFHMVEDFKDESVPIVNTDYRFSALLKAVRTVKNGAWAARFQAGHESTHLGDEFTIHAIEAFGSTFERVNVSYEYWELGASRMVNIRDTHYVTMRAGAIGLIRNQAKGFYSSTLLGGTTPTLTPSTSNLEWLAGLEWQRPDKGIIGPWAPLASVDVRLKTVYNYHRPASTSDEQRLSTGVVIGLRHKEQQFNQPGVPMLIAKFYYGVNPNGQFRSQAKYFQWGIGLLIPM